MEILTEEQKPRAMSNRIEVILLMALTLVLGFITGIWFPVAQTTASAEKCQMVKERYEAKLADDRLMPDVTAREVTMAVDQGVLITAEFICGK